MSLPKKDSNPLFCQDIIPSIWPLITVRFPDAGKDWGQEEKGMTEDEMVGWHHWLDGHGFGWTPGVGDRQGGLACCGSWGLKESDTIERLTWTELNCHVGLPRWSSDKESACQCRRLKRRRLDLWVGKIPLEKGMAPHSSILAWRIPWTEEPGRLQSTGSERVRHDSN